MGRRDEDSGEYDRPRSASKRRREDDYEDEVDDEEDDEEEYTRQRFHCKGCGSRRSPVRRDKVSGAGWAVFWVLLIMFFPLCWIGLLMREKWRECSECSLRVGRNP